jgi:EmrB/QacA subfamily drug resistance transporter
MTSDSIESLTARYGRRHPWYAVLAVMFGNLAITLPPMIIYVALPDMMRAFQVGESQIQWLVTGLQIASTVSMVTTTWLVRRLGQRNAYLLASLVLVAGSILGGCSTTLGMAVAGRVLQGIACGVIPALSMVTIVTVLAPTQLGLGMSAWGVSFAVTAAVTPYIGGILVESLGWQSVSFAAIPLALPGIVLGRLFLPGRDPHVSAGSFDWLGLTLLSAAIGSFLYLPILGASSGWHSTPALTCAAACVAAFVGLVVWQLRARHPLFEVNLFSNRRFTAAFLVALVYDVGMYGTLYLVPLFAQTVGGYSPSLSGSLMLPGGIAFIVVMMISGPLCNRWPSHYVSIAGLVVFALSCYLLTFITPATSFVVLAICLALSRAGSAILLPALSVLTVRVTEPAQHAAASVNVNFARIFGGAIGSFALALFYDWRSVSHQVALGLPAIRDSAGLSAPMLALWQQAKTLAVREAFWVMAALFLLAVIPALIATERAGRTARLSAETT